jgi:hypothetical protein
MPSSGHTVTSLGVGVADSLELGSVLAEADAIGDGDDSGWREVTTSTTTIPMTTATMAIAPITKLRRVRSVVVFEGCDIRRY